MSLVDLAPLLDNPKIQIAIGDGILGQLETWWLSLDMAEKFAIAPPMQPGFAQAFEAAEQQAMRGLCEEMLRHHHVGLATWAQFGPLMGHNDVANLPELCANPGADVLHNAWQGKPAVCIAAGPSLQKNLALLQDPGLRAHVGVITVGTMLAPLRALGIVPDVVTTIDFQALNWTDQFRRVPLEADLPLVYLHSTWPQTPRRWPGPRFVAQNGSDFVGWLRQYLPTPGFDASYIQTVAHLNVLVALTLGANPIVLVGQDLSMPASAHHAPGARAQDCTPQEAPDGHLATVDYAGQPTWTRHSWLSMQSVFRRIVAQHPDRTWLNCTEGGLAIPGVSNAAFRPTLEALPRLEGPRLRTVCGQRAAAWAPTVDWGRLQAGLTGGVAHLQELQALAQQTVATPPASVEDLQRIEQAVQGRMAQFNMAAVRRFDLIQACAALPPDAATTTEAERLAHQAARAVAIAQALDAVIPAICGDLRTALRRVEDLARAQPPTWQELWRMLARQSYQAVAYWLERPETWKQAPYAPGEVLERYVRLRAELDYQRQQYTSACTLLDAWDWAPGKRRRAQQSLTADYTARAAAQAYWREASVVSPHVAFDPED